MKAWKFFVVTMAAAAALALVFGACSKTGKAKSAGSFASANSLYAGLDLGEPVTLYIYMLGDPPKDMDEVMAKANADYFEPVLNATVKVVFLSWSDYTTKYPLILAAGEDVDIIFTAPWCFYEQEAAKGSFLELSDDFIAKWMPQTAKAQSRISWMQARASGKVYAVPQLRTPWTYDVIAIHDELRKKYGLPEIDSWENYEKWVLTIAENEKSIQAEAQGGGWFMYMQQAGFLNTGYPVQFLWRNNNNTDPAPGDIEFAYTSTLFRDCAVQMARWMEKGVWSRNVMNNTISRGDLFTQGKSATVYWNASVFNLGKTMEDNGIGEAAFYDVSPQSATRLESGNTNMWAIAEASAHPERAALALDLMKTDKGLLRLLMGGIEGRHYIDNGDGTYSPGPEADDYPFNGWCWALNSPDALTESYDKVKWASRAALEASIAARAYTPSLDGFVFDKTPVSNEYAVVSALINEYEWSFECGIYGDATPAKFDEFKARCQAGGIDKVLAEFRRQYAAFLENN